MRRKLDGVLLLDKPVGPSSSAVLQAVKRLLEAEKAGHAGTLDPLASGLLTGKYKAGIPEGSRGALESMAFLREGLTDAAKNKAVGELEGVAADYRTVVLSAFADVENQLSDLRSVQEQVVFTDRAVASARRAAQLADKRYRAGEDSYFQLIDTQRNLLTIERQSVKLRGQWASSTVGLIRALGGSWDRPASPATP